MKVAQVFLTYPTKAFVGHEERQYEILNDVADFFIVPITSIQEWLVLQKLGYNTVKKKLK